MMNEHDQVLSKVKELYQELFDHDGYGQMEIEMKFLKRGQKEIIIHCGKDYRYVVNYLSAKNNNK